MIGTTAENLEIAANEEKVEGYEMYLQFADTAEKEGFADIAEHFRAIATIEERHRNRFLHYLDQVEKGLLGNATNPSYGNASCAATSIPAPNRPRYARHATTPTSTTWAWITNKKRINL